MYQANNAAARSHRWLKGDLRAKLGHAGHDDKLPDRYAELLGVHLCNSLAFNDYRHRAVDDHIQRSSPVAAFKDSKMQ